MKKVIINADDFGLTRGINQAIIECYKKGVITSSSLIPNGKYFKDAVELVKDNVGLDLGIHLTLIEEKPILSKGEIPSLLNENGYFYNDHFKFIQKYIARTIKKDEIEKELRSQIERCLKENIELTHIDSHQYIHLLPSILNIAMKLAKEYKIPFIRYPHKLINIKDFRYLRISFQIFFNTMYRIYHREFKEAGILATPYSVGFVRSGRLTKQLFEDLIKSLRSGVTEIVCHPGILDEDLKRFYSHWNYHWQEELDLFSSEEIKILLSKYNIELIAFRDLL